MRGGSLVVWSSGIVVAALSCGGGSGGNADPGAGGTANEAGSGSEQGGAESVAAAAGMGGASGKMMSGEPAGAGGLLEQAGGGPGSLACGDGVVDTDERCDDGNANAQDGCSNTCRIEPGWSCDQGEPTHCVAICGDGLLVGIEAQAGGCDDGHAKIGDGCSDDCTVEPGYVCTGEPSTCAETCDNGELDEGEGCEDGNAKAGDGCNACVVEAGFACDLATLPTKCSDIDECKPDGGNDCAADADCTNTKGSFTCACKSGFTGDGLTCTNVDECAMQTDNCGAHATCTDSPGSFKCKCNAGYAGDGLTCTPRSCASLIAGCGVATNDDCCASPSVTGGGFTMGSSTVGKVATFELDKYEVTVGRFRAYLNAYAGAPAKNAGAHPLIAGSGWQTAWNSAMPVDKAALTAAVQCDAEFQTWEAVGTNDFLPMNCVTWYEAFAFCAWDGGRLPTELEWQYASKGGSDNRIYPWGNTPVPTNVKDSTEAYADYDCLASGTATCVFKDILRAGSRPAGASKFNQMDLAGSMWEWLLDWNAALPATCDNCANLTPTTARVELGGGWTSPAAHLTPTYRVGDEPTTRGINQGFRCAR